MPALVTLDAEIASEQPFGDQAPLQLASTPKPAKWGTPSFWLAAFLIIAISLWMGAGRRCLNTENPAVDIANLQAVDVDYHMLYPSLQAKTTFAETFKWWREPWRADEWVGAYWRPLTMQAWWMQGQLFGSDRPFNWMRVSLLLAVLFDLLLLKFLSDVTRNKWLGLAGLAIFAIPPSWYQWASPLSALPRVANADLMIVQGWKDQPDLWANCLILGALIFALKSKYGWALICTALAIGFKESGLMAFPLVAILAVSRGEFKKIPVWVYGVSVAMLCAMMFGRWLAGPLVFRFHSYGGDGGAFTRYSNALFPLGWTAVSSFGALLFAAGVFALVLTKPRKLLVWLLVVISLFAGSVGLVALQEKLTLDVALAHFILISSVPVAMLIGWLLLVAILWRQKEYFTPAVVLAVCGYVLAIPFAMATQAAEHCLALTRGLLAGYGACVVFAVVTYCRLALSTLAKERRDGFKLEAAILISETKSA